MKRRKLFYAQGKWIYELSKIHTVVVGLICCLKLNQICLLVFTYDNEFSLATPSTYTTEYRR